ncbi:MAG: glycine cleavage T C-terminal barrel domain-containing protein, partial [Pseudomonadales bacterium]|nr:glycine cleavage T C-terminal barrel domain-containing protein [Pseudomonadales bacterium]
AANGVSMLSRSFKRHRPRGLFSLNIEDTGGIVRAGEGGTVEPNARATMLPATDGSTINSQNHWPSLEVDALRILDVFSDLFPAGFYNKTFKWPNWHWYEWAVRLTAGFGVAPAETDASNYDHRHQQADVLVCGGGAAGLAAALAHANTGQRVILVEQDATFGGSLRHDCQDIDGKTAAEWLAEQIAAARDHQLIELHNNTIVAGLYDHNYALLVSRDGGEVRETLHRVRADQIVLATGAIEQPLVFENNDRPGIMLLSAVQGLATRFGVTAGENVVIAGNHDHIYAAATGLSKLGVNIRAIIDARVEVEDALCASARDLGIEVHTGHMVVNSRGGKRLSAIAIAPTTDDTGGSIVLDCDTLGMSGGYAPAVHLACHAKAKLDYHESIAAFVPRACGDLTPVGAAAGDFDLAHTLSQIAQPNPNGSEVRPFSASMGPRITPRGDKRNQWVDWLHDVTLSDLDLAVRENYRSVEHLKRYTTNGMSIDQGKTSNLNALTHLADITQREIPEVGTTTYRPPYAPVTLGTLAGGRNGRFYTPIQRLPMHAQHEAQDAVFEHYGSWQRPAYYGKEDEQRCINAEVKAVREGVGIFDGSPLGKVEVRGPDAAEFLHRVYLNNALSLKPGNARYGLMLNENGIIIDDGVFARLAEDHFLVSTTSGNATRIYNSLEEWLQCEWVDLDVTVTNATTAWANVTMAGPKARELLSRFDTDIDLSKEAFPHQTFRSGTLDGVPVRILRASFSGEVSFEVNVPNRYGIALWDAALERGADLGVRPYGVEAVMVMRIEKGYLHIGSDTDGTSTPDDVGWGHVAKRKKAHFIGKRSLMRPNNTRDGRHQFVGLAPVDCSQPLVSGAHLARPGMHASDGYVTSAAYSPTLDRYVGLGLLKDGRARIGETIDVVDAGERQQARVVEPVHYDPEGTRLNE